MNAAQYFAAVVTSVEHGRRKPSRCIFERGMATSGGTTETSIYVGDSFTSDYLGAVATGLRCLLIDPEHRHNVPEVHRLTHVAETKVRLDRL